MRILNIGSGTQIFQSSCEDRARMAEYGKMVDRFDILISCCGKLDSQQISDNVFAHATNSRFRWLRPINTLLLGDKLIKEYKIDVIFCQDPLVNGLVAWLLTKKNGAKLVVSIFGTSVFDKYWQKEHWYNFIFKFIGKIVMKDADVIQTDGYGNLEILKKEYGDKVFWKPIVPSDIDKYIVDSKNFVDGQVRIAFVGRMAKQKNIAVLAKVVKIISEKKYPVEVVFNIAGDGPERFKLEQFSNKKNVNLIKNCSRQELDELYKNNDILIMTSFYEGFPRVFMEAAANGLAFVVTNVSGAKNIVDNGKNGYVIAQEDTTDFVTKLEELINNRHLLQSFSEYTLKNFSRKYYYKMSTQIHQTIIDYLNK